ncbi:MAG: RNA polymerase subunit sigma [Lachnospiraceae bacterium]|nr:RNA polymerase subunit sigma [Lachnospiraceae bacterium]
MDDFSRAAVSAKESDEAFNRFAAENKTFILGCASKSLHRYVRDDDDEWSIALIAFHEAVRVYKPDKGSFGSFAGVVIKRRLLDEERRRLSRSVEIPVQPGVLMGEYTDDEEDGSGEEHIAGSIRNSGGGESAAIADTTPLQDEIEAVQSILAGYGFSFFDLTECSPRSRKTKEACRMAVGLLLNTAPLFEKMRKEHSLPIKALCNGTGLQRKLMDRHRRYIIAAAEILKGDFPLLGDYLSDDE